MIDLNLKLSKQFIFALLVVLLSGCTTLPRKGKVTFITEFELTGLCLRNNIEWQWDSFSHTVTLKGKDEDAKVIVGSNTAFIGEQAIVLSRPVIMEDSQIIVPADFESLVLNIIKRKIDRVTAQPRQGVREIIIDPGHGGKDPGAIGKSGLQEKNVVLDISKRLYKELKARGFKVSLTRDDDTFISLQNRTEIASQTNADLFISIHANSNTTRSVYGLEIYTLKNLDVLEKNEAQRNENHNRLFKELNMDSSNPDVAIIISDMLYSHKQEESELLAPYIAKSTSRYINARNRGAKTARFFVLRNTLIPAVLVEVGYISNPKEENLLSTGEYRQKIALGIAKSIVEFIHGEE